MGGPEDGNSYTMPDLPPYLYFPFIPEPLALLSGPSDMSLPNFEAPKLVYKHVINGLYSYQGIVE